MAQQDSNKKQRSRQKSSGLFAMMSVSLILALLLACSLGSVSVPFVEVMKAVGKGLRWLPGELEGLDLIIYHVRLPRVLLAALVGGVLAISGAVLQGLFRNPMADPGVLGVSSGASLGAVMAIAFGLAARNMLILPLFASVGALTASVIVFALASRRDRVPSSNLILSGMAVSMIFGALTTATLTMVRGDQVKQFLFWTTGNLNGANWQSIQIAIVPITITVLLLSAFPRDLNILMLGEDPARSVGLNPDRTRKILLLLTAVATASAVCVSGTIGFVGLMVPHVLRLLLGPDHRRLLPACLLMGATFLIICDLIGRTLFAPLEISVGIVTALLGAPYLLWLLFRANKNGGVF